MNIIQDYLNRGWSIVAIPPGGKGPRHEGWQTRAGALSSYQALPLNYGVGLMHAYSGTMALDVDDWARTVALGIDLDALAAAPDSVMISSGKINHGKLLYRMPMGLVLPSKQITENKKAIVNFRCGTMDDLTVQDVLPPTIHPDTGSPYVWAGNGHWSRLPLLPGAILDYWRESLKDARPVSVNGVDSSWEEIQSALDVIDPDCSRTDWVQVGMAIQHYGEQKLNPEQAFAVWDAWSAKGEKYKGTRETAGQWRSFRSEKGRIVTIGTLYHIASLNGWTRPTPDASTLFGDVSSIAEPGGILKTMKAEPPDINLALFPPVLTQRAEEVSNIVGCDPIVPLWAGLAAVCGVIDAQTRLELMHGFKVPPVLWLMTIGDPGDRKTPGSKPMMEPIKGIELSDRPRYTQAHLIWQAKQAAYASAHNAYLKHAANPEALLPGGMDEAPKVPPAPNEPVSLKITVGDITSQELLKKCVKRPRGMLCFLDEMNSWVQKLTNKQSGENRSTWVQSFEASNYEMDRVNNGENHCDNFAVSIYGNMQPQVLDDNFAALAGDGLLQRFLPAVLRHNRTRMGQPIPDYLTSANVWDDALRRTAALEPRLYRLSPEAFTMYREFQAWYEDQMHNERLINSSNEFLTAFGKITGLVGRLALVFHILEYPWGDYVSEDLMRRVIRIAREYVIPVYRFTFDKDGAASAYDSWVMEHIIQHADLDRITMSDIKRSARRPLEKANVKTSWQQNEWTIGAMFLLEQMNWVARWDDRTQEGRGHAEWLINPHLKETFKFYREKVVKAKLERNQIRLDKADSKRPNIVHGADQL